MNRVLFQITSFSVFWSCVQACPLSTPFASVVQASLLGSPVGQPGGAHLPRPAVQAAVCTAVVHENHLSEPCALRALRSVVPCGADVALFTAEGQRPHPQNDRSLQYCGGLEPTLDGLRWAAELAPSQQHSRCVSRG